MNEVADDAYSWDDVPWVDTSGESFRGGIWKKETVVAKPEDIPEEDAEDEAEAGGEGTDTSIDIVKNKEARTMSTPALPSSGNGVKARTGKKGSINSLSEIGNGSSSGLDRPSRAEAPRVMRSTSFATVADPMVSTSHADGDYVRRDSDPLRKRDEASTILKDLSSKSAVASPSGSPYGSPPNEPSITSSSKDGSFAISPEASRESLHANDARPRSAASSLQSPSQTSFPQSPSSSTLDTEAQSVKQDTKSIKGFGSAARSLTATDRKQALASINAATAAAQKWGWGVINRNKQKEAEATSKAKTLASPMGRGHPLPPPGIPLPPPERSIASSLPFTIPKRKPVPPPLLPKRPDPSAHGNGEDIQSSPRPALPERRNRQSSFKGQDDQADEVLVVEAPQESTPTSPAPDEHRDDFFGHGEEETSMGAWESSLLPEPDTEPAQAGAGDTKEGAELAAEH